jgi:hypothetical protein
MEQYVMEHQPVLIVIDVLSSIHHENENQMMDMSRVLDAVSHLARNRALLIVHHTAKPNLMPGAGQHSPSSAGRGSNYLGTVMEGNWLLKRSNRLQATLEMESRISATPDPINLTQSLTGLWLAVTKGQQGRPKSTGRIRAQEIINAQANDGYTTCLQIATTDGVAHATFDRAWADHKATVQGVAEMTH